MYFIYFDPSQLPEIERAWVTHKFFVTFKTSGIQRAFPF